MIESTMLILSAILIASLSLSSLADASAIKGGHARPNEEARSIKLASVSSHEKPAAVAAKQVPAAPVAILESTKRIYNDESIRRLVQAAPPMADQVKPVSEPVVVVKEAPVVAPQAAVVAPVVAAAPVSPQQAPVVAEPVVVAKPVVEQKQAVVESQAPVVQPAVVEPRSVPVEPKQPEQLPPQSDRSASSAPASVVVVEQVVKAAEQPAQQAPVASQVQAEPVVSHAVSQEESSLQAKKDEAPQQAAPVEAPIEVPAPDPGLVLSEPIDSTTKLLIDLDEHVQKFLPVEEQQQAAQPHKEQVLVAGVDYSPPAAPVAAAPADPTGKSSGPLVPYSSVAGSEEAIVPPLPSLDGVEKASNGAQVQAAPAPAGPVSSSSPSSPSATRQGGHQHQNQQQVITQLLDQLDSLQNRIQDTINQLVARRRYVMSALLRPMGTYVRRVRTNLERLQNRVNQLQAAAVSVGGGQNRPGGFVDAAAIETIRRRIDDISKRISDIVNRIRFSLTPTSAPLNSNGRK